jgi:glycosyltransferase involved in cell wall biosynthesis
MARLTVSFCIPTHNRTHLLLEALESGLAQTRLPDEIVVSDDMGSEETRALVSRFAQRASFPVRYVHCTTGRSQTHNLNSCLLEAACDLTLVLHDDDLLMPKAIEVLARLFEENSDVVGAYGKQWFITDGGEDVPSDTEMVNRGYRRTAEYVGLQRDAVLSGIWQQFPNDGYMVRSAVARNVLYRAEYKEATDFDFGIRMGKKGKFYFIDEFTSKYRHSLDSIVRGAGEKSDDCGYYGMLVLSHALKTYPHLRREITATLEDLSPMGIWTAARTGRVKEAAAWYFGPFHRNRILTPGGIRRGLFLARSWLRPNIARS